MDGVTHKVYIPQSNGSIHALVTKCSLLLMYCVYLTDYEKCLLHCPITDCVNV
jgi:hypothetical protein